MAKEKENSDRIKLEALENAKKKKKKEKANNEMKKEWCINGACYGGIDARVKRSRRQ